MKLWTAHLFYRLMARMAQIDLPRRRRRLPADGPARARGAAGHARAQPLPARDDGLGRLQPDGGDLRARRAHGRRDEVHACARCCASPSTRSRASRTSRCSWRRCWASRSRCSPSSRIPVIVYARIKGQFVPGVSSTLVALLLLGGIQLITVGVIGEYVGRIYDEVKRRPLYVVKRARSTSTRTRRRASTREGRGPRRRRGGPRRRAPARPAGPRRATSTSAGRASAARRRRSTSAAATCSSATTTTCSPPTATSPTSTTSSAWRDELEWRPSSVAFFADGPPVAVRHPAGPAALQAAARRSRRVRMGAAVVALQRFGRDRAPVRAHHRARVDRQAHGPGGVGEGLGAAAARQVRRARRGHRDGLAVEQVHPAPPDQGRGGARRRSSATRGTRGSCCSSALQRAIEARGRARADRPPRRAAGARRRRRLPGHPGRARLVPRAATTRAALRGRGRARALRRASSRRVPNDVFDRLLDDGLRAEVGEAYLAKAAVDRVLRRAVPAARARPPRSARTTGPTSPTASCRSSA